jgi:hypothetical protein
MNKDKKPKKSTKENALLKLNSTYEMLINGYSRREIVQFNQKKWSIGDAQTDSYIQQAKVILLEESRIIRKKWKREKAMQLKRLYQLAVKNKSVRQALNVIQVENKVFGYEKLTIDDKRKSLLNISFTPMTKEEIEESDNIEINKKADETDNTTSPTE